MSRLSFFFTSLVAAVPAAFLAYVLVTAFLLHFERLPTLLMVVAGLALLLAVAVVLLPVLAFTTGRSGPALRSGAAAPTDAGEAAAVEDEEFLAGEGVAVDEDEAFAADEGFADEDAVSADDQDVFVEGDEFDAGDDFDDFDETPKKK